MLLLGIGTCIEAPEDIYPYVDIPVVTIVWSYSGLPPQEMEGRIVTVCERALTTTVNDIGFAAAVGARPLTGKPAGEEQYLAGRRNPGETAVAFDADEQQKRARALRQVPTSAAMKLIFVPPAAARAYDPMCYARRNGRGWQIIATILQ